MGAGSAGRWSSRAVPSACSIPSIDRSSGKSHPRIDGKSGHLPSVADPLPYRFGDGLTRKLRDQVDARIDLSGGEREQRVAIEAGVRR